MERTAIFFADHFYATTDDPEMSFFLGYLRINRFLV